MENYFVLPKSVENMQLPDPELLTYYNNLENRIIWLESEVDGSTLEIIKKIVQWNVEDANIPVEDRKPIQMFFFSPGGDLDTCFALIDVIDASKTPIYGYNIGMCASAAAFIFLSCHKRFMLPNSYFLFHQGSIEGGGITGNFSQVVSYVEQYQEQVERLSKFMSKYTRYDEEEIVNQITTEWYVRADEAIENGVCDEVITQLDTFGGK